MVKGSELETPERGMSLETRSPLRAKAEEVEAVAPGDSELALRARIEAARDLKPNDPALHCFDCWRRGRDAALRAVEGGQ